MNEVYYHGVHGLVKLEADGTYLSWRGGFRPAHPTKPATENHFEAALSNAQHYDPGKEATVKLWHEDWLSIHHQNHQEVGNAR